MKIFIFVILLIKCLQTFSIGGNEYDNSMFPIECGKVSTNPTLNSTQEEHPWNVLIKINQQGSDESRCGGSLINEQFLVTAAHCFESFDRNDLTNGNYLREHMELIFGEWIISKDIDCVDPNHADFCEHVIKIPPNKIVLHESYNIGSRYRNDIAIIKLEWPLRFTPLISPICVPHENSVDFRNDFTGNVLTAVGFGGLVTGGMADVRKKMHLNMISIEECQAELDQSNAGITLASKQICGRGVDGIGTCKGDSGGSLVTNNGVLIGLVSFGRNECRVSNFPTVFTQIADFVPWMRDTIRANDDYGDYFW